MDNFAVQVKSTRATGLSTPQGNRALRVRKTSEKSFRRGSIPTADRSFASETSFDRSVVLQNRERQWEENGTKFRFRSASEEHSLRRFGPAPEEQRPDLDPFLAELPRLWQQGEVRPMHRDPPT